ncbi:MAG: PaaI family thioesterase [Alphaproteobacteria bacterium]|jgi:acyl-coenzyme A thioesterase PaaI-like protein|nr:PaaI family thioesterase [Alphaproteobacteria bacterium]MBN9556792.1 PaaI family thioesterase [Alphaproteobacteria bacterium]MBN9566237.1 PaaI family thioesterase [Alphaproteobacteria bacterium]MBN9569557.1 PaaI family thioesterase [Alphaproteobacteria bacterium]MBN9578891.1 PaaI family thioesterase [Alphaproteobacteria bacterium]
MTTDQQSAGGIPDGFAPFRLANGFVETNGPLYGKWTGDQLLLGFRVEGRHCNPGMVCHGGMLALFADMMLPIAARLQGSGDMGFLPTVNLTCDYLAPAPLGSWVEGRADAVKTTRNLLFAQGLATANGVPVLRANGIFKITSKGSLKAGDFTLESLFGFEK